MGTQRAEVILTVDAVITDGKSAALIRRTKAPFEDRLVLPGGHVEAGETLAEACLREAEEEVGLVATAAELKLLTTLDKPNRDPRPGRRVSVVFLVRVSKARLQSLKAGSDAAAIVIRSLKSLRPEEVGFDHFQAITATLEVVQEKTMKVLKEGNWKQKWEKEMTCSEPQCGATLLVEEDDLKPVDYSSRNDYYAECAVCGHSLPLKGSEVPLRLQRKLAPKRKQSASSDW